MQVAKHSKTTPDTQLISRSLWLDKGSCAQNDQFGESQLSVLFQCFNHLIIP